MVNTLRSKIVLGVIFDWTCNVRSIGQLQFMVYLIINVNGDDGNVDGDLWTALMGWCSTKSRDGNLTR